MNTVSRCYIWVFQHRPMLMPCLKMAVEEMKKIESGSGSGCAAVASWGFSMFQPSALDGFEVLGIAGGWCRKSLEKVSSRALLHITAACWLILSIIKSTPTSSSVGASWYACWYSYVSKLYVFSFAYAYTCECVCVCAVCMCFCM